MKICWEEPSFDYPSKTIVAIITAIVSVENNMQVAIMAPTEILAHQHYKSSLDFLSEFVEAWELRKLQNQPVYPQKIHCWRFVRNITAQRSTILEQSIFWATCSKYNRTRERHT